MAKLGSRRAIVLGGAAIAIAVAAALVQRARAVRSRDAERAAALMRAPMTTLLVPHLRAAITLDGDMDDLGWRGSVARTGQFVGEGGAPVHPYSDARIVWGDGHLYVALYAADEDIRATRTERDAPVWLEDSFHLWFDDGEDEVTFDLSPLGTVTDGRRARGVSNEAGGRPFDYRWNSGVHVSKEVDGTLNDPKDEDEEWGLELAIPFASLGLRGEKGERVAFAVKRCDTTKAGARVCASWGDAAHPALLVLD